MPASKNLLPTDEVPSAATTSEGGGATPRRPRHRLSPQERTAQNDLASTIVEDNTPETPTGSQNKALAATGSFIMKVLNGISIAVVVALVPQALLGELFKALLPLFPQGQGIITIVSLSASMLPLVIGLVVGMQFKLTQIQTATVAVASVCGSGVAKVDPSGGFHVSGTGLVINTGITAALAVLVILAIGDRLKNYAILGLPVIVLTVAGGIGWYVTYPGVKVLTVWLGNVVNGATSLQPIVMGCVLAVIFGVIIASPISTVGIATAIMMSGVSSGVANVGCCACGFALLVAGWKANGAATSLIHVIGSPKVQMANMMRRPIGYLPVICSAAVSGTVAGFFGVKGTAISAGFGLSGLIGPLAALNAKGWGWSAGNILIVLACYVLIPLVCAIVFNRLFANTLRWIRPDMYKLNFE